MSLSKVITMYLYKFSLWAEPSLNLTDFKVVTFSPVSLLTKPEKLLSDYKKIFSSPVDKFSLTTLYAIEF